MTIPLILGVLFLVGLAADLIGRSTFMPRMTLLLLSGVLAGTRAGGSLVPADPKTRNWLGLALLPQAGVAIGMALLAAQRFPNFAQIVLTVVVAATFILETVGPIFARQAIREVQADP